MDQLGIWTSSAGLGAIVILIGIAAWKRNLAQIYQNVIYMSLMFLSLFTLMVGVLRTAGAGAIIFPLTSIVGIGLVGVAGIYSERAKPFKGMVSPLNLSALVVFFIALSSIGLGAGIGMTPFLDAHKASVLAAAAGLADSAMGSAHNALLVLLTPLFVAALTVITNFATRDAGNQADAA